MFRFCSPARCALRSRFQGPHEVLTLRRPPIVIPTTVLEVSNTVENDRDRNISFKDREVNAAEMVSTFGMMDLDDTDDQRNQEMALSYSQVVLLDFFPRQDGLPGSIRWQLVSINTMQKVSEPDRERASLPSV